MNIISLTGNLVKEPKMENVKEEKVGKGILGVNRPYNREISDFFEFDIWGNQADYFVNYAHKGDRLEIIGIMENHKYTKKDGTDVFRWIVRVNSIQILPKPKGEETKKENVKEKFEEVEELDDDNLPF